MKKFSLAAKKMCLVVVISALAIMIGGAIFYRTLEALNFALGVFLSTALTILKIYLLDRNVSRILDMDDAKAGRNYFQAQYIVRYLLTGAVLVAAALIPFINIYGAVLGVLTMQIAVFAVKMMKIDE